MKGVSPRQSGCEAYPGGLPVCGQRWHPVLAKEPSPNALGARPAPAQCPPKVRLSGGFPACACVVPILGPRWRRAMKDTGSAHFDEAPRHQTRRLQRRAHARSQCKGLGNTRKVRRQPLWKCRRVEKVRGPPNGLRGSAPPARKVFQRSGGKAPPCWRQVCAGRATTDA
jgi:hypothetical protein